MGKDKGCHMAAPVRGAAIYARILFPHIICSEGITNEKRKKDHSQKTDRNGGHGGGIVHIDAA
ncbi:MAG: hypothetical protein V8T53_05165 [Eubacteriales bacterium]